MTTHIDNIITGWARVLYGLRTLRSHGIPPPALHAVFQSTAVAKVTYAAPVWWDFTNSADRNRLEAFIRRAVKHGYCTDTTPTLLSPRSVIKPISTHPLHILLPPTVEKHYSIRSRRPLLSISTENLIRCEYSSLIAHNASFFQGRYSTL